MNCPEVRELLLEGDSRLFADSGSPQVGAHLEECVACRALATRLAVHHELLTAAYQGATPQHTAVATVATASAPALAITPRPIHWRRWGLVGVGVAATALLIFRERRDFVVTSPPAPAIPVDSTASSLSVEVPPGRNALITSTRDPNISVVWFY